MAKYITTVFLIFLFTLSDAQVIQPDQELSLQECIDLTLRNNPALAASQSGVQAQYSRLWQSRSAYMPQVNASANYSLGDSEDQNGFKGKDDSYSSSISATQLIYDFGQTGNSVDIQKNTYHSAIADTKNLTNNTLYNLKKAFYGVISAKESKEVFIQSVEQYQEQLKRAQAFYSVGTRPKIDVTTAQVNLNNAKLNLIKADNALQVAYHTLLNVMGIYEEMPDFKVKSQSTIPQYEITAQAALERAMKNRPDLASYRLKLDSARMNVTVAKTGYAPTLNANASYGWNGGNFPLYDRWSLGAGVSVPIFSGLSTYNKVQEANSNLVTAYYNLSGAEQDILLEIKTAYLNFKEASSRIPVADLSREQAQENYQLAVGRYTVGVGNYIEVKDAEVTLSNAKLSYISAVLDYNLAIADLKRVMGTY